MAQSGGWNDAAHSSGGCGLPPPFSQGSVKVNIYCLVMSIIMLQLSILSNDDSVPNACSIFNHAA
jgi:hypothetical protein